MNSQPVEANTMPHSREELPKHRSAPVPTQPPQRLVFPLTPKQEEEGGVVKIL